MRAVPNCLAFWGMGAVPSCLLGVISAGDSGFKCDSWMKEIIGVCAMDWLLCLCACSLVVGYFRN